MRNNGDFLFTSESVSDGHPDKVADRISDTVLDAYLRADPEARVACETMVTTNRVILAGEVRGPEHVEKELESLIREAIKDIGYDQDGFSWRSDKTSVTSHLHEQSCDIAVGVDQTDDKEEGAGDQGIMFGYACDETPTFMPAPIHYSHEILKRLREIRKSDDPKGSLLGPDAKSQVTLRYKDGRPVELKSVVVSTQHAPELEQGDIRRIVQDIVNEIFPAEWLKDYELFVNPTGNFVIGGPDGDAGLTGRKIIVDTYGGAAPHGGGAFSGKDPTKVDRSAAYAARYLAKNVVAAGLAKRCTIQLSYAIGVARPLSVYVDLHGTGNNVDEVELGEVLNREMNLSPAGIRKHLRLNKPIYAPTSSFGHFGRIVEQGDDFFTWEQLDLADKLKEAYKR